MKHFDDLETRASETRERAQFKALQEQIANAKKNTAYFGKLLAEVQPHEVTDRASLARLPVTRKSALIELQKQVKPFAGMNAVPLSRMGRVFASPVRYTTRKAIRKISGVWAGRCSPPGSGKAIWSTTRSPITLRPRASCSTWVHR